MTFMEYKYLKGAEGSGFIVRYGYEKEKDPFGS
jgi:hypothetical protein